MRLETLDQLFTHELKDIYDAEQQLLEALPKLIEVAASAELRRGLDQHLRQTEQQVTRLEQILSRREVDANGARCKGMEGLLRESEELLRKEMAPAVKDAAIISAAQRVEHYEMAAYGSLRTFAQVLGDVASAKQLQQTLDEEADADRKLTQLAEFSINEKAAVEVAQAV